MITAVVTWQVEPGISRAALLERLKRSIPVYRGRAGLVRKYICLDLEHDRGYGIYLWEDRESAEAFYAMARPIIRAETGAEPDIRLYDTAVVVDNFSGETNIYE